ncbi:MAG TPA: hypothetical protein VHY84_27435 [Bryobacteraceae bacterium]|jgi:hypothetical protein|nr:hypothetical protein [Bryobacteraceae bacterium]
MKLYAVLVAACLFAAVPALAQQTAKPDAFSSHQHVPLAAVPTSATPAIAPSSGAAGVTITSMYFVNTNASAVVTVTVSCTTGGAVLVEAAIPGVTAGGNNIPVQLPADGIWCAGGVTWVASASGVNGTIAARY